jgi:membrane complex biogenesis BtpA family protein
MATFKPGKKLIVGMIHVGALPGTPRSEATIEQIVESAVAEAEIYTREGLGAIMIENMHDRPYLKGSVGPETVAAMTRVAAAVNAATPLPCGVQILAGANREAIAVAQAAGMDFIRAEGFVFAHVADEGLIESSAGELLRYRRQIGAGSIQLLADIKKKHSAHSITADTDIAETAKAAEFFLADGLIVTGGATGAEADIEELASVRAASGLPLCVGSGITAKNASHFLKHADALIVGSHFKRDGHWEQPVCPDRVSAFVEAVGRTL